MNDDVDGDGGDDDDDVAYNFSANSNHTSNQSHHTVHFIKEASGNTK
jgi:hypothetical protein